MVSSAHSGQRIREPGTEEVSHTEGTGQGREDLPGAAEEGREQGEVRAYRQRRGGQLEKRGRPQGRQELLLCRSEQAGSGQAGQGDRHQGALHDEQGRTRQGAPRSTSWSATPASSGSGRCSRSASPTTKPVQSIGFADYEAALATMALAPGSTLAALPVMQAQGHGRIVTITLIGGKLSVPDPLPHSMAKFAAFLASLKGCGLNWAGALVTVTTVVPGLMRTGSHVKAEFAGRLGPGIHLVLPGCQPAADVDGRRARGPGIRAGWRPGGRKSSSPRPARSWGRLAALAPELTAPCCTRCRTPRCPPPTATARPALLRSNWAKVGG